MTTRGRIPLLLVCCTVAFLGCSITQRSAWLSSGLRSEGALQLIERDVFEPINLVALLNPEEAKSSDGQIELEKAFAAFYKDKNELELRRNRVQERLLAASNQRCNEYKQFIKQINTQTGFILGSLATTLAGVGAILTPASTVRALAGSAAITSGIRAEFQQDYFANLAVEVITKGIDARRKTIYEEILKRRESAKDIKEYPVEAAVKDAIFYHGACGLLAGLEEAGTSIERARDPGLNTLNELFEKNELIHRLTFGNRESMTRNVENKLGSLGSEITKTKNNINNYKKISNKIKEDVDNLPIDSLSREKKKELTDKIDVINKNLDTATNKLNKFEKEQDEIFKETLAIELQIKRTTDGNELIDFKNMLQSMEEKAQKLKTKLAELQEELKEIRSQLNKVEEASKLL